MSARPASKVAGPQESTERKRPARCCAAVVQGRGAGAASANGGAVGIRKGWPRRGHWLGRQCSGAASRKGGEKIVTERQETIVRNIGLEIKQAKAKCQDPAQENYVYWCGYRDGLDKAHELAQYATEVKRNPLLLPMLESGVHNTNFKR